MKNMKKKIKINKIILLFFLFLIAVVLYFTYFNDTKENNLIGDLNDSSEVSWQTYENNEYNFSLEIPVDWLVFEDLSGPNIKFNFYPKNVMNEPPFTHFSENQHLSVYPNGIATEGIHGQNEITLTDEYVKIDEINKITNYILNNEEVWAQMITFSMTPDRWKEWGFIWHRFNIINYNESCFSEGEPVSVYDCNVFTGDEIRRFGEVSESSKKINQRILQSFKFLNKNE